MDASVASIAEHIRLPMNRTNSEYALPSKAAEDRRTPRRYRVGDSRAHFRQVLECAGPAALWIVQTGSWSQCMRKNERRLSMNLPEHRIAARPWESGAEDARTPNADAWSDDSAAR